MEIDEQLEQNLKDSLDNITVTRLMGHVLALEDENDPERIEEYDAFIHVLSFLMDEEAMIEWSTRDINTEWLDSMVTASENS